MTTVQIDLPDGAFSALKLGPDAMAAEMRKAAAAKWYDMGRVSQGMAAQIAGVSRAEFLVVLSRYEVSPFQYTAEELEREIAEARERATSDYAESRPEELEGKSVDEITENMAEDGSKG
jgi:predicted HTH domain antitoxin